MDGYYQSQVDMPYFQGTARQRGRGLGAVALRMGRTAIPLLKKYVLPAAKRIGREAIELAVPELMEVVAGRANPKAALKRVAAKTAKSQLGLGKRKKKTKRVIRKRKPVKRSRADILGKII